MNPIWKSLIRIAARIGRWLLEHAARKGLARLVGYMDGKADDFERRLAKAKTERRREWLRGRIKRWRAAVNWLIANGPKLGTEVLKSVCALPAAKKLPLVAACEVERTAA